MAILRITTKSAAPTAAECFLFAQQLSASVQVSALPNLHPACPCCCEWKTCSCKYRPEWTQQAYRDVAHVLVDPYWSLMIPIDMAAPFCEHPLRWRSCPGEPCRTCSCLSLKGKLAALTAGQRGAF